VFNDDRNLWALTGQYEYRLRKHVVVISKGDIGQIHIIHLTPLILQGSNAGGARLSLVRDALALIDG
jgi:hypothetical protein